MMTETPRRVARAMASVVVIATVVGSLTGAETIPVPATSAIVRVDHEKPQTSGPTDPIIGHADGLLIDQLGAPKSTRLTVTSPSFKDGADIPFENTQYRGNRFPGLRWTPGPYATRSYVLIMQGEGLQGAATSIHAAIYNIAASVTTLDAGMTALPPGASWGPNVHGLNQPYAGPHPHTPARQRYHLQVFALDTRVRAARDLSFGALKSAMRDHVLASGDLVGWAARDPQASPGDHSASPRPITPQ